MFLHLVRGDPKFLPAVYHLYESAAPGENRFVCFMEEGRSGNIPSEFQIVRNRDEILSILEERDDWSGILCNGLLEEVACIAKHASPHIRIAWIIWGMEIYNNSSYFYHMLYGTETRQLVAPSWKHLLRPWVWRVKDWVKGKHSLLKRIDYCICPFREEYELIVKRIGLDKIEHIPGWVGARSDESYEAIKQPLISDSIQVGNSATFENNHLEVFERLAQIPLGNRKVIVPLSYGNPRCRRVVTELGGKLLGANFYPIYDFLPLAEYNQLMAECSVVVLNHNRQQGLGNIMTALRRGAQVYLQETPVFHGLRELGIDVLTVRDLDSNLVCRGDTPSLESVSFTKFERKFSLENRLRDTKVALARIKSGIAV